MDTKGLRVEIKDEAKGQIKAVFSTFNVVDSDRDVTRPGALDEGAAVLISSYGHRSWEGELPVGKGSIRQTSKEGIFEGEFFMNTDHGRNAFLTVLELAKSGLGEWSYGYEPVEYSFGEFEGQQVRFLDKLKVFEVSPVLRGAGANTRTLSAKSAGPGASMKGGRPIAAHDCETTSRSWDGAKTAAGIADDARPSELRTVYGWVDADGDPEAKASYKFAHHHGVGGPANTRACLMGIARLNDPTKGGIPDADREGVYKHLASHLRDADIEPPELRAQPGGSMKFHEEGHAVLAAVSSYIDRASEVLALRARKGRTGLAPAAVDLLSWVDDDVRRLKALLSAPIGEEDVSEELASSYLRSVAGVHGL